jgi:FkbM family methyltransferase
MESVVDIGGTAHTMVSDDDYLSAVGPVFEPETVGLFGVLARGVALDVGANIGCTALALSSMCDAVHAFEPVPSTFDLLRRNVDGSLNIQAHNIGLGASNKKSEVTFATNNRSGGFVSDQTKASAGHTVEPVTIRKLDSIRRRIGLASVDFVKIDVEGFEASVLMGAKRTLRKFRPVVTLELNHWCLNAFQRTSVPDFFDYLRSVFPILYAVHGRDLLNIHDDAERYIVMYRHIVMGQYNAIVGAFDEGQLADFLVRYGRSSS